MKTLLILRHAKSSWADEGLEDHERPLNRRGLRDAPRMGHWAATQGVLPDAILCSTAVRAHRTAAMFAEAAHLDVEPILSEALYLAGPGGYLALLRGLPDETARALVVGHNPGLEDLVTRLSGRAERMPTAALAVIDLAVDRWADLPPAPHGELRAVWRPKEIDD